MDILRPGTFPEALREADCVVYAVAANGFSEAEYRNAYVTGLANTIEYLMSRRGRRRLVHIYSTGVYGQDDGSVVDEKFRHWHGIWHLFVVAGSATHYAAIVLYVA